ncbi:leucyl/phenylalanyl-tRNA--protein transferase [Eionea flava]
MLQLTWLDPNTPKFPNTQTALAEPNGLLAAGGQLSPEWLLKAYSQGIFPWFNEGEPILWWSPSPRTFLFIDQLHISRSLQKAIRKSTFTISFDRAFEEVMLACSEPRGEEPGTWISEEMIEAYTHLHQLGHAHSIEVWEDNTLVGGLYGIAQGRMFFGESMFSRRSNSSKIALFHLVEQLKQWHYVGIDCQVHNNHLASLGAKEISRQAFEMLIKQHVTGVNCHWGIE